MNKIIRWPGLITFAAIVGGLIAIVLLFTEPLLRWGLGTGLTRANGAEVNISDVNVRWSPFALELRGVQFTDPDTPELNRLQAERISFSMSLGEAIVGRIHIQELTATGIAMGVERDSPGRVRADYLAEREAERDGPGWRERLADLDISLPSTDELLARGEIRTPEVVDDVTERTQATRDQVAERRDDLPSSERLATYEERLAELRERRPRSLEDFDAARRDLRQLRDDIRSDRDAAVAFRDSLNDAQSQLRSDLDNLRQAPEADIQRIRSLLAMDSEALSDLTGIFFGPQVQQWTDYILIAYDFVGPMLQRFAEEEEQPSRWEGRYIEFDRQNRPSFLIDLAHTEITFGETSLDMRWDNITWQHERLGESTKYRVTASASPYWQSLSADGDFFINEAIEFSGTQEWSLRGAELGAQTLLEQSDLTARLTGAMLNSDGRISLSEGAFSGGGGIQLSDVGLRAEGDRTWVRMMNDALTQIQAFDMDVGIRGRMGSPRLSLSSDLDDQLSAAFSGVVQEAADERVTEVRARLQTQVDSALADVQPRLDQVNEWRQLAENREDALQNLLDQEVENLQDSARDALENRLRDAIRGHLGRG